MDRKEIVKKLIEMGIIPTPEIIEKVNKKGFDALIKESIKGEKKKQPTEEQIEVNIRETQKKKKLSPKDFASLYKDRYEKIQKILSEKIDVVSINKIKNVFSEISIIGMVIEKTLNGFLVEDLTGKIEVVSTADVSEDDVIGIKGHVRENKLFANEIVYPDIPFNREIGKMKAFAFLVEKPTSGDIENIRNSNIIVTSHEISDAPIDVKNKVIIKNISNPAFIEMKRGKEKIGLLVYKPHKDIKPEQAIAILKKRCFPIDKEQIWSVNTINTVPDIFWIITSAKETKIYKGILLIFSPRAMVNLETKEVEF
jgi:protein tyrosine phosphatase (PTP) superfamily phosphohydrolase (DUF442 family)